MTEKNNIYIEDVVDVKELQTLQDNWAKATDLAFVTVDCNGTPITKQSNFTPFCKRLRELDAFREKCYYCDACGGRKARRIGKAYVYICHAGLIDFAIPIMIKGQYVGAFLAGQVTSTDFADLKKITTQSEDWKDNQELVELYSQVKEVSVEKIEAVAQIICDSYNYSVEREYANKVNAELREKDYKLMKEEKLRIEMEKSLRDIELKALHYQINPHFLYNSLSIINWKAIEAGEDEISHVTLALSTYYRTSLNRGETMTTVAKEIDNIRAYLKIQLVMHDNEFRVVEQISDGLNDYMIPKLILQPLAENAIDHGIDVSENENPTLWLTIREEAEHIFFEIRDNGAGMTQEKADQILTYQSSGYGVRNVCDRIHVLYGEKGEMKIESTPGKGTRVFIRIPKNTEAKVL